MAELDGETRAIRESWFKIMQLLLEIHEPKIKEVKTMFSLNMFDKSNPKGFQCVIYYLIHVAEGDSAASIVPWPLHEKPLELLFRRNVLKYLNDLNKKSDYANMPNVTMSHLITPGGRKFIKIIGQYTQYVTTVCIRRDNPEYHLLLPPKEGNTRLGKYVQHIHEITKLREKELNEKIEEKVAIINRLKADTEQTTESSWELARTIEEYYKKLKQTTASNEIESQLNAVDRFVHKVKLLLEYNSVSFDVKSFKKNYPNEMIEQNGELNLKVFLQNFLLLMTQLNRDLKNSPNIENSVKVLLDNVEQVKKVDFIREQLEESKISSETFLEHIKNLPEKSLSEDAFPSVISKKTFLKFNFDFNEGFAVPKITFANNFSMRSKKGCSVTKLVKKFHNGSFRQLSMVKDSQTRDLPAMLRTTSTCSLVDPIPEEPKYEKRCASVRRSLSLSDVCGSQANDQLLWEESIMLVDLE